MSETIRIPFNRKRLFLLLIGCILFCVFGAWFVIDPYRFVGWKVRSPELISFVGILSLIFFGLGAGIFLNKLIVKKYALIIHPQGFLNSTVMFNCGYVKWEDIKDFYFI